jgi:nitronate monooxygenase
MSADTTLDDFRLRLGGREFVPLVVGGMGVDISTRGLALEAARLGGIGHLSDAMLPAVVDGVNRTRFVKNKLQRYKFNVGNRDKAVVQFDLEDLAEATRLHVAETMSAKRGSGAVFINCMEKLTMGNPAGTLRTRLAAALDAGIDGITLSAGLHLGSFSLIEDHPRFRDAWLGVIVSSLRALKLFLKKSGRTGRLPDYVVVEGPLAGGHLGFGMDWADYDLASIVREVVAWLREQMLDIAVIPAGGIFSGGDAVDYMKMGASAVQVATRFTITRECGLPAAMKKEYLSAQPEDIVVNTISPTGYPMRMLRNSPAIGDGVRPNCEAYGYLLDRNGHCAYIDAHAAAVAASKGGPVHVHELTCLCTQMRRFKVWTCGHYAFRLKETASRRPDGGYDLPSAEHVFRDYQSSSGYAVHPPAMAECAV